MTMEDAMRFSIVQIEDGPWIVVDREHDRRMVASCPDGGAAKMIAALMNGQIDEALAGRDEAIAGLNQL
jgi:hypothetical protein